MQAAHPAVRFQDAHPVAASSLTVVALDTQHPTTGRLAGSVGGPVGIGLLAGWRAVLTAASRRTVVTPVGPPGLRLRAGGGQQTHQHRQHQATC